MSNIFAKETVSNGYPAPLWVGTLIFDEVKVMTKVVLKVKNETCLGLAMSLGVTFEGLYCQY